MTEDFLSKEYFTLVDIVKDFDQRLLTIKGWGVTLSLAALGLGFQYQHYGLFLVAAISGMGFWIIEAIIKRHQMRYYVRMREIEVRMSELNSTKISDIPTPQIDWSWFIAPGYFKGIYKDPPIPPRRYGQPPPDDLPVLSSFDIKPLFFAHVFLPHIISVVVGGLLFILGITGGLQNIRNW
jgi:hypothetical protein